MPGVESRQQPGAGAALVPLLDHVAAVAPGKHVASVASRSHVTREHLAEDAPAAVGLLLLLLVMLVLVLLVMVMTWILLGAPGATRRMGRTTTLSLKTR